MAPLSSAEILTIGTELLLGEIDDTNSAWLASDLAHRGVDVFWTQRLGDNLGRVRYAIERALERSELVVLTGGLGPTDDDLTRDAVAEAVGEQPVLDPRLESDLRARFAATGRSMPDRNLRQAMLIPSATSLPNPIGTAPGWLVRVGPASERANRGATASTGPEHPPRVGERVIVTLPGPPREMTRMWSREVVPRLSLPDARLHSVTLKVMGIGEGLVAERLGHLTDGNAPSVATYAKRDGVHVRIAGKAASEAAAAAMVAPVEARVRALFGDAIWGSDDDDLADLVVRHLEASGRSLALAEVGSSGTLAEALGNVPGAAQTVRGAVIAYAPETMATLGVPLDLIARLPGAVAEVVVALAAHVRALFGTDLGVAVGPVSEVPDASGGGDSRPDGYERGSTRVLIAIASNGAPRVETITSPPLGQAWLRERLAFTSLALLRSS